VSRRGVMAASGTLGSCKRFNNNKTRTIGFQQQINKLYMEEVSVPKISVNQVSALHEWSKIKEIKLAFKTVISSHYYVIALDIYVFMCFIVMGYGMHIYIYVWLRLYYLLAFSYAYLISYVKWF
jgi:hypothetical protein